jgi:hypothetical protein
MRDQALVQVAGKHRDAVHPGVMTEPMAGHADLAATSLEQHVTLEIRPLLHWRFEPCRQHRWPEKRGTHETLQIRTPVLAEVGEGGIAGAVALSAADLAAAVGERTSWLWNIGIGLIIRLLLLSWLMHL